MATCRTLSGDEQAELRKAVFDHSWETAAHLEILDRVRGRCQSNPMPNDFARQLVRVVVDDAVPRSKVRVVLEFFVPDALRNPILAAAFPEADAGWHAFGVSFVPASKTSTAPAPTPAPTPFPSPTPTSVSPAPVQLTTLDTPVYHRPIVRASPAPAPAPAAPNGCTDLTCATLLESECAKLWPEIMHGARDLAMRLEVDAKVQSRLSGSSLGEYARTLLDVLKDNAVPRAAVRAAMERATPGALHDSFVAALFCPSS